jgi:hypothetical protein
MSAAHMFKLAAGAALALALATPVAAQWAWRDAAGKMVFSDQPPPPSVGEKNIVRRPAPAAAAPSHIESPPALEQPGDEAKPAAAPPSPARQTASPSVADRELASRVRQQQLAEAQKKAAEDEARRAQIAENCERLRSYQRALDEGLRIARVNAAGENVVLEDAERAAESARTRLLIDQQCR